MIDKRARKPALRRALEKVAQAIMDLVRQGLPAPIVVGGAAVSLATGEAVSTGDIDLVYANDVALARALTDAGFLPEDRIGHLAKGFYDSETAIGVEAVGSRLFDGRADERRCIAIAAVGFMMLTGRLNWRYGATVILGCFILFGAGAIVAGIRQTAGGF